MATTALSTKKQEAFAPAIINATAKQQQQAQRNKQLVLLFEYSLETHKTCGVQTILKKQSNIYVRERCFMKSIALLYYDHRLSPSILEITIIFIFFKTAYSLRVDIYTTNKHYNRNNSFRYTILNLIKNEYFYMQLFDLFCSLGSSQDYILFICSLYM